MGRKVDEIMRRHAGAKRSVLSKPLREYRGGDVIRLWLWLSVAAICLSLVFFVLVGVLFGGCCLFPHVLSGR